MCVAGVRDVVVFHFAMGFVPKLWLLPAILLLGCGGSSSEGSTGDYPQCFTELTVDGAYANDGTNSYGCGSSYARGADAVTLGGQILGSEPNHTSIQVKVYGLDESKVDVTLAAGVALFPTLQGPSWQTGFSGPGDCEASIESQAPAPESWTLVTASVTCSRPLQNADGTSEVTLQHLRLRSVYGPAH